MGSCFELDLVILTMGFLEEDLCFLTTPSPRNLNFFRDILKTFLYFLRAFMIRLHLIWNVSRELPFLYTKVKVD